MTFSQQYVRLGALSLVRARRICPFSAAACLYTECAEWLWARAINECRIIRSTWALITFVYCEFWWHVFVVVFSKFNPTIGYKYTLYIIQCALVTWWAILALHTPLCIYNALRKAGEEMYFDIYCDCRTSLIMWASLSVPHPLLSLAGSVVCSPFFATACALYSKCGIQ